MKIYEKAFLFDSGQSFLKLENRVYTLKEADIIVINQYALLPMTRTIDLLFFESLLLLKKPIYIDATFELIEQDILQILDNFSDLSNVIYFAIPREQDFCNKLKEKLYSKKLKIVERQFFIDYAESYVGIDDQVQKRSFLCLNGKTRPQRTVLVSYLSYFNLIDKGYVSFFGDTHVDKTFDLGKIEDVYSIAMSDIQKQIVQEGIKKLKLPLLLDEQCMTRSISHSFNYNASYYKAVEFIVITETNHHPRDNIFFVTEKTTKAINNDKKILVHSTPNFIAQLKEYYYKNFKKDISHLTDWCDLSYDKLTSIDRVEAIIDIIKKEENYGSK